MPGGTFLLPAAYAAPAVVVADGVMAAGSALLSSATAAFTILDEGKPITVAGAGPAAAPLVTYIKRVFSATKVELNDAATTGVAAANLTYSLGVYRLRNLLRKGDTGGNVYDILYALRLQLQANSLTPAGVIYVGGPNVTPTNAGTELTAGQVDDQNTGRTLDDFVTSSVASGLLNIEWQASY